MGPSSYKETVTRRGIKYSYFVSPSSSSSVTVLLLHGFPSTARDWRKQVPALQQAGYAVIAPDMLGYGGTDKPTEKERYKYSEMAADLIDILDAERVGKAIVVGHDWGCAMTSRLANYYPERFLAFAFLAVGYLEPHTTFDFDALRKVTQEKLGYDTFGYWDFFSEEGAHIIIHQHFDSFFGLLYPGMHAVPPTERFNHAPLGTLKASLLADKPAPLPLYLTQEDKDLAAKALLSGPGFAASLNWYKIVTQGVAAEDNKKVKEQNRTIRQPVFFGGASLDRICVPAVYKASMPKSCPNLTVREYPRGHWLLLDRPEELNRDLLQWISSVTAAKL